MLYVVQLPAWPRTSKLHSSLLCHYGKIGYLHYQKFHPLQKRIFRPLCIAQQTIVVLHRLGHGLRTTNEAFFQWYPKLLGLGRQIGPINFMAFGVFSAKLSAPILARLVPCPCFPIINHYLYKKLSFYTHIPTIYLGLGFEFEFGLNEFSHLVSVFRGLGYTTLP